MGTNKSNPKRMEIDFLRIGNIIKELRNLILTLLKCKRQHIGAVTDAEKVGRLIRSLDLERSVTEIGGEFLRRLPEANSISEIYVFRSTVENALLRQATTRQVRVFIGGTKRFSRNSAIVNSRLFFLIINLFYILFILFLFSLPLSNFLTVQISIVCKGLIVVGGFLASDVKKSEGGAD